MSWFAIAVKVVEPSGNPIVRTLNSTCGFIAGVVPTFVFTAGVSALFMWTEYKFHPKRFKKTAITLTSFCSGLFVFLLVGVNG